MYILRQRQKSRSRGLVKMPWNQKMILMHSIYSLCDFYACVDLTRKICNQRKRNPSVLSSRESEKLAVGL